ncbi:hypothetical protein MKK68_25995 [Methylobacterium sp. E-016]|uniref:DUF6932 family protein n=1 Tax=Methylobacterium sp. E-016 TaxID=2836556 RepID=UPI001FBB0B91|nr:hypothetical protein [Methylobacterium sp. E-016]MCJ2079045.1 hypothetical protein [Methylobacterium sp. E-016]
MIPHFNLSLVIPPFVGADATDPDGMSPYEASMTEVVGRFGITAERAEILEGLLDYREELRRLGIVQGFQWIAGSFCENVEIIRNRPPGDVDIVTFAYRHIADNAQWDAFFQGNPQVFDPYEAKQRFKTDAYYVDFGIEADFIVDATSYWSGLFSHQRNSHLWKGMLKVSLASDDAAARAML